VNRSLKEMHGQFYQQADRLYQIQYHPAAGMRFPNVGVAMARDFEKLSGFIQRAKPRRRHKNN